MGGAVLNVPGTPEQSASGAIEPRLLILEASSDLEVPSGGHPLPLPTVIVYGLADAEAALAAAQVYHRTIRLIGAEALSAAFGPTVFTGIIEAARRRTPAVNAVWALDCGTDAALAIDALREGVPEVVVRLRADVHARMASIAQQLGGSLCGALDDRVLDLATVDNPERACREWLKS